MINKSLKVLLSCRALAAALILIGAVACKSSDNVTTDAATDDRSDMEALYWARVDSSRMSFTDADVMFMKGMIGHHAQALVMSALAPENGAGPAVQRLAARIINAQKDEISTMQQWLRDREQPVPEIEIDELDLTIRIEGELYTAYRNMHGVLSQDKLQELSRARGTEFDRLFLTYMIEHHAGAVHMVRDLFDKDGAAQDEEAFRLASDIQVDQITEIERMELMLNTLNDRGK